MKVTSSPACTICAPAYPPTAPAPTIAIFRPMLPPAFFGGRGRNRVARPLEDSLADRSFPPTGRCVPKAGLCHAVIHGLLVFAPFSQPSVTHPAGFRAVRVFGGDSAVDLIRIRMDPPLG